MNGVCWLQCVWRSCKKLPSSSSAKQQTMEMEVCLEWACTGYLHHINAACMHACGSFKLQSVKMCMGVYVCVCVCVCVCVS